MANKKESPKNTTPAAEAFTHIRVTLMDKDTLRGMASAQVSNLIWITGMRIILGKNGVFVSMPSRKTAAGEYQDVYFPASKEVRDFLGAQVIEAYNAEIAKFETAKTESQAQA